MTRPNSPNPARSVPPKARPNTLNLSTQALASFLDKLDEPEQSGDGQKNRTFVRWPWRLEALTIRIEHPGGNSASISVACRNLSRGGISVLHNSYIHPGSQCRVLLPHPKRGLVGVAGLVVRCIHRGGVAHEVGISFTEPVNAREFVNTDPLSNVFTLERVNPGELKGTLLLIEPAAVDRHVYKHFLRETLLRVVPASTPAEAVASLQEADVVLIGGDSTTTPPAPTVATLRSAGFGGPILLVVPDSSDATRLTLTGVSAQSVIAKPITHDLLLRALAEVLLIQKSSPHAAGHEASRARESQNKQLVLAGVDLLRAACGQNPASLRRNCLAVRSIAESLGASDVMALTDQILAGLTNGLTIEKLMTEIEALVNACDGKPAPDGPAAAAKPGAKSDQPGSQARSGA